MDAKCPAADFVKYTNNLICRVGLVHGQVVASSHHGAVTKVEVTYRATAPHPNATDRRSRLPGPGSSGTALEGEAVRAPAPAVAEMFRIRLGRLLRFSNLTFGEVRVNVRKGAIAECDFHVPVRIARSEEAEIDELSRFFHARAMRGCRMCEQVRQLRRSR